MDISSYLPWVAPKAGAVLCGAGNNKSPAPRQLKKQAGQPLVPYFLSRALYEGRSFQSRKHFGNGWKNTKEMRIFQYSSKGG